MSYLVKYPHISSHLPWGVVLGQHLSLPALALLVRRLRDSWPRSLRITPALESRPSALLCSWGFPVVGGCGRTLCQRQHCGLSVEWEREKPCQKQACCSPKVVKEEGGEGKSTLTILKCVFHNSEYTNYKCHTLGFIRLAYFHNFKKMDRKKRKRHHCQFQLNLYLDSMYLTSRDAEIRWISYFRF